MDWSRTLPDVQGPCLLSLQSGLRSGKRCAFTYMTCELRTYASQEIAGADYELLMICDLSAGSVVSADGRLSGDVRPPPALWVGW